MPTYDYQCRNCGRVFEVIHPMSEDGPSTCEVCGGQLRRILHPAGIIFKGSGFYKTDSRSSGSASVPSGSKSSTSSGESAGTSTTPSKPSTASEGGGGAAGGASGGSSGDTSTTKSGTPSD